MARVPITDLPIRVFTPMTEGDTCVALIGQLPIRFEAATPFAARRMADDWRKENAQRLENEQERIEKRAAARQAEKDARAAAQRAKETA